ncbi:trypsin-like serine protease [Streptomyces sp. LBUM 1476]|nr:trypsin-like serine protease [Streptomyces sp. LBUM 1476]
MDPRRLALIRSGDAERHTVGSGYLIAPRLVLTARHVLIDRATTKFWPKINVYVGHERDGEQIKTSAQRLWEHPSGLDIALLQLAEEIDLPDPVRWGRPEGRAPSRTRASATPGRPRTANSAPPNTSAASSPSSPAARTATSWTRPRPPLPASAATRGEEPRARRSSAVTTSYASSPRRTRHTERADSSPYPSPPSPRTTPSRPTSAPAPNWPDRRPVAQGGTRRRTHPRRAGVGETPPPPVPGRGDPHRTRQGTGPPTRLRHSRIRPVRGRPRHPRPHPPPRPRDPLRNPRAEAERDEPHRPHHPLDHDQNPRLRRPPLPERVRRPAHPPPQPRQRPDPDTPSSSRGAALRRAPRGPQPATPGRGSTRRRDRGVGEPVRQGRARAAQGRRVHRGGHRTARRPPYLVESGRRPPRCPPGRTGRAPRGSRAVGEAARVPRVAGRDEPGA